ncbi:hypothetical protein KIW84_034026 [Lathyrus oleraceus]|uniref:DUF7745 domain-containing protein n=1 Tax=Pisum sativum TaxID=3888 RepID=A0A9D5B0P3_PEA|nr:hypothetical protein KIW84_034026 [Pisum sativum]
MGAFEDILVLLIYGLALFPNIDSFVDVNAIRIFLIGNLVPTLLGDMYFSLHFRSSKAGGTIVCCVPLLYKWFISHLPQTLAFMENRQCLWWSQRLISLTNDDIVWYDSALGSLDIIDCCDKPNNIQLEGLFYQEGKDPQLLKSRMVRAWHNVHRKGRSKLGPCNCIDLEAYTLWVKKRALELKIPYACERPMFVVVAEPSTFPNQDHEEFQLESKDKDALIEILEEHAVKRQREPNDLFFFSMLQPSGAWKKIVDQLVLEKDQMKTSFESEIRRIRRKYAPIARSSDTVARDP